MAVRTWQEIERSYICDRIYGTPTITASGGSDASYPKENLLTYARFQQWKSGATGAQSLIFDLGGFASGVNAVAILNHNHAAAVWGTTKWQWSSTGTGGPWTDAATLLFQDGAASALADDDDYFIKFSSATKRYWKLDLAGATGKPMIGNIVLGRCFAYQEADLGQMEYGMDYQTVTRGAQNGPRHVEQLGRRLLTHRLRRSGMPFATSPSADWAPFNDLFYPYAGKNQSTYNLHQGDLRPFVFIPRPDGISNDGAAGRCFYSRYEARPKAVERFFGVFDDSLEITEEA